MVSDGVVRNAPEWLFSDYFVLLFFFFSFDCSTTSFGVGLALQSLSFRSVITFFNGHVFPPHHLKPQSGPRWAAHYPLFPKMEPPRANSMEVVFSLFPSPFKSDLS